MAANRNPIDATQAEQTGRDAPAEQSARPGAGADLARRRLRQRRLRRILAVALALFVLVAVADLAFRPVGRIVPPPPGTEPGRWVFLEGAANTRDLGGYTTVDGRTVRRGRVYRSGNLGHLSSAGVSAFRDLGVTTVIDLRNRLTPLPWSNGDVLGVQLAARVRGCRISFEKTADRSQFYVLGVQENQAAVRRAFELLAQADGPVLYHCAAGVDRTGVLSALLLRLLGVSRADALADFRLSEQIGAPGNLDAMNRLLDEVDRQGGIEQYLLNIGVSAECQRQLRQKLLEPPPSATPAIATPPH